MGMQISCDIHPKLSAQGDVRMDTQRARADHAGVAQQKESEVEEGHLMADHVHMMLSIPPKYSVSGVNERPSVKTFLMAFGSVDASYRFSYDK
jgi:REP element-mobilizing transposase RayT